MKKLKTKSILTILTILIFMLMAIGSGEEALKEIETKVQDEQRKNYTFVEEPTILEEGNEYYKMKYIVGVLKNETNKKSNYVQVVFNLYDKDGNVIGSAMDNINHIESGGTWRFKAIIMEDNFDSFKFESVSGF